MNNLRQKWIILMKWLSQITPVSHSHLFSGSEVTNRDVTVYMVPMFTSWLNKPSQRRALPFHACSLLAPEKERSVYCCISFRFVSNYYFFIAGSTAGTRAGGLMFWTGWFFILEQTGESRLVRVRLGRVNQSVVQGRGIFLAKVGSR